MREIQNKKILLYGLIIFILSEKWRTSYILTTMANFQLTVFQTSCIPALIPQRGASVN